MSVPILATKLFAPELRPNSLPRDHLIEQLNEGLSGKLTVVSAPAGYGKSTLVGQWLANSQRPYAWLTVDERDNDLHRFLYYLVAALQAVASQQPTSNVQKNEFGSAVLALLNSPPPTLMESVLTTLVNEISTLPEPFIIVLDDFHLIRREPSNSTSLVDEAMTFLLSHMPPQMHVLIISREQPRFSLARLRAHGHLNELRTAGLRFSPDEIAEFLQEVSGLKISTDSLNSIDTLTEGWAAILQLIGLSIRGRQTSTRDIWEYIRSLSGNQQHILDYLVEEILSQQPTEVQEFLLCTSVLERISSPLCDALPIPARQAPSEQLLISLMQSNLLIVPLDTQNEWFRYHHLFADALRSQLQRNRPDLTKELHRNAAGWYLAHDYIDEAIDHALAAHEYEMAADLIEQIWSTVRRNCFRSPSWLGWVNALPYEIVRVRPVLSVGYAWELLNFGEAEAAEQAVADAERLLNPPTAANGDSNSSEPKMVVVNQAELPSIRAMLANTRAFLAQSRGDMIGTAKHAQLSLELVPRDDHFTRGLAASFVGLASWASGELETAFNTISEGMASLRKAGNLLFILNDTFFQMEIRMAQGRLREAVLICENALAREEQRPGSEPQGVARLHIGLGLLQLEMGQLEAARESLQHSAELGKATALPDWPFRHHQAQALLELTENRYDRALGCLDEAERLFVHPPAPLLQPIHAMRARIWIRQGRLLAARQWAREQHLSSTDSVHYMREYELITVARLLLETARLDRDEISSAESTALLERLLVEAESQTRKASTIELHILQALTFYTQQDVDAALSSLRRALKLAASEPFVRLFVAEAAPMRELLARVRLTVVGDDRLEPFVNKLITSFGSEARKDELVEALTPRESEVLNLIAAGHSNPQIATELVIALTTVKTHVKNIYGKLQVSSRVAAVTRANELELL